MNPTEGARHTLLFGDYYDIDEEAETDTRPDYLKVYVDTWHNYLGIPDDIIARNYGDWVYMVDCATVDEAYTKFMRSNVVYCLTHDTELKMLYKAFTTDFNPLENYDRHEDIDVDNTGNTGTTAKVSTDDTEAFYNMSSGANDVDLNTHTDAHIHGNIGVTTSTQMLNETVNYFVNNSWYDTFINKIIKDGCFLVDYDYHTI